MIHEIQLRVRYGETDQMGIAHHAQYIHWLEIARTDYLRALGYRYRDLEARGLMMVVVDARCRYRAPARYDELLTVRAWIQGVKRLKVDFGYEILGEGGARVAEGFTLLGCVGRDGRPRAMDADVHEALRARVLGEKPGLGET